MSLDENRQKVVKFVQELLLDEDDKAAITPALIAAKIDMVIAMKPSWGHELDRDAYDNNEESPQHCVDEALVVPKVVEVPEPDGLGSIPGDGIGRLPIRERQPHYDHCRN